MANDEQVALLKQGVAAWNAWRLASKIPTDLSKADLGGANLLSVNLSGADLREANLSGAHLSEANLRHANLRRANLSEASARELDLREAYLPEADLSEAYLDNANLRGADLREANLSKAYLAGANLSGANLSEADFRRAGLYTANLSGADLRWSNLMRANLSHANLSNADLRCARLHAADLNHANLTEANLSEALLINATLVNTNLTGADLTGCRVHGVSVWGLKLEKAKQQNLVITGKGEPGISVDNIEVAQFVYLLLNNQRIRDVIDTITSKAVLILGRFTDERKAVLGALREELRKRDYLPILFDFDKPTRQTTDETITLLARMARFVIADISDAKSVLQELRAIVPDLPSVPVQSVILETQEEPGMFDFYRNRPSFLPVHRYADQEQLVADLGKKVIRPAELKVLELQKS